MGLETEANHAISHSVIGADGTDFENRSVTLPLKCSSCKPEADRLRRCVTCSIYGISVHYM